MSMIVSLLAALATAQALTFNYTLGVQTTLGLADSLVLCNSSFDAANATGIYYQTPQFNSDARFGAAVAISQDKRQGTTGYGFQGSVLFTPLNQNYFNDSVLGYDVCTMPFNLGAMSYNTWLRGQYDDGTCAQTLDTTCVADLKTLANSWATQINQPSTEVSGALSGVCQQLLVKISANTPSSCKPYLTTDLPLLSGEVELTQSAGLNTSVLTKSCTIEQNGTTWYNVNTQLTDYSDLVYDLSSTAALPVLTVFMPPADNKVRSRILAPETLVTCLRINHVNDGSRVAPSVGTPTPVSTAVASGSSNATAGDAASSSASASSTAAASSDASLSGGAIAGIVIGALALVLIALGIWLFLRHKKQHQPLREGSASEMYAGPADDKAYARYEHFGKNELSPDSAKSEMPAPNPELMGGYHHRHELHSEHKYHEMG